MALFIPHPGNGMKPGNTRKPVEQLARRQGLGELLPAGRADTSQVDGVRSTRKKHIDTERERRTDTGLGMISPHTQTLQATLSRSIWACLPHQKASSCVFFFEGSVSDPVVFMLFFMRDLPTISTLFQSVGLTYNFHILSKLSLK